MTGYSSGSLSIAICDRCKFKRRYLDLVPDGNLPGLRVCKESVNPGCRDPIDPYRLPARKPEAIAIRYPRPDTPIGTNPAGLIADDGTEFIITEDGRKYIKP